MAAARGSCRRASVIKLAAGAFPTACRFSFLGFELSFSLGSLSFFCFFLHSGKEGRFFPTLRPSLCCRSQRGLLRLKGFGKEYSGSSRRLMDVLLAGITGLSFFLHGKCPYVYLYTCRKYYWVDCRWCIWLSKKKCNVTTSTQNA